MAQEEYLFVNVGVKIIKISYEIWEGDQQITILLIELIMTVIIRRRVVGGLHKVSKTPIKGVEYDH